MSTWLLLRGLMRERRHWGDFPAQLGQAMPGARVLTIDLPGNGEHYLGTSPSTVAGMADFARERLRAAGHAGPVNLLALSLGAMVAVEWSARYPHEVARCVLINTSMRPFSAFHERLRWQNYPSLLKLALRGGAERQEATILRLTSRLHGGDRALLARWAGFQRERPVSRANALRQLLAAARYRAPEAPPALPLLVLASRADALVDVRCSQRLAAAWGAQIALHTDAGHDLPLDDGPWVADQVARWVLSPI